MPSKSHQIHFSAMSVSLDVGVTPVVATGLLALRVVFYLVALSAALAGAAWAQGGAAVGDVVFGGYPAVANLYVERVSVNESGIVVSLYFYNPEEYLSSSVLVAAALSRPEPSISGITLGAPFQLGGGRRRGFTVNVPEGASLLTLKVSVDGSREDVKLFLGSADGSRSPAGYGVHDLSGYLRDIYGRQAAEEWDSFIAKADPASLDVARRLYFESSRASIEELADLDRAAGRVQQRPFLREDPLLLGLLDSARAALVLSPASFDAGRVRELDVISQSVEGGPFLRGHSTADSLLERVRQQFEDNPEAFSKARLAALDSVSMAVSGEPFAAPSVFGSPLATVSLVVGAIVLLWMGAHVRRARLSRASGSSRSDPEGPSPLPGLNPPASDPSEDPPSNPRPDPVVVAFSTLGLTPSASRTELETARAELLRKYHPDRVSHLGPEFKALAEGRLREVFEAYDVARRHIY